MVKNLSLSIFILILSACGQIEHTPQQTLGVDFAFIPFIEEYKTDKHRYTGSKSIKNISVIFQSMNQEGVDGLCSIIDNSRIIRIDPVAWFYSSYYDKLALFYHEMGHCDLGILEHTSDNTIMNTSGIWGYELASNRDYYLNLLFTEGK